ncbi:MAG: hypothetical protein JWR85_4013 [Marmoricola sp.]|nr:hypothetical protein [Marmoricola sp.]
MATVSFIGLGTMGVAMARRLIQAGHEVNVWNRSPEPKEALVELGAFSCSSPEQAWASPIVMSMLANDAAVREVFTSEFLDLAPPNAVHVAMESLSPAEAGAAAQRHAAAGVAYLAAPVIGRPNVAASGKLTILAGGDPDQLSRVQPFLNVLATQTRYFGPDPSTANVAKVCVNYTLMHTIQALSESLTLAEAGGIAAMDFVNLLTETLFPGAAYSGYGKLVAEREYEPVAFSVALGLKDLSLAESMATQKGITLPAAPMLRQLFQRTLDDPKLAQLDWSAIAESVRRGGDD